MNDFQHQILASRNSLGTSLHMALRTVWGMLCVLICTMAFAQDSSGSLTFPEEETTTAPAEANLLAFPETAPNFVDRTMIPNVDEDVGRVVGVDGRLGFIGLKAFGRDDSIAPIELFPYVQTDNRILFGDLRGFITTDGRVGGNFGMGYRFIGPNDLALFGANVFYDADNSTGRTFQQMSVGWEARLENVGMFGNVYLPVGTTEKTISQALYNERFNDHNILFDVRNRIGKALTGLDLNFQAYLPGAFLKEHQVQATAGWYYFQGNSEIDSISGYKLQLQGNIIPAIGAMASVTQDSTYGTNGNVGIFWRFGSRELPSTTLRGQLRRFVDRNYNVILARRTEIQSGIVAHNSDGSVMIVQHVSDNGGVPAGSGDGTAGNPFTTIDDALNASQRPDLIFVQSGSVINEANTVVLGDGQTLLGEGTSLQFHDNRYGVFNVPGGTSSGATPQIKVLSGDAVVMGNNSQIAGFKIVDAIGHGIVAQNVDNIRISNVTVENAGGDGIILDSITGSTVSNVMVDGAAGNGISIMNIDDILQLNNISVQDTAGNGVLIDGGLGTISFTNNVVIRRTGLAGFSVQNMEKLTETDDRGTPTTADDIVTITPSIVSVDGLIIDNRSDSGGSYGAGISTLDNEGLIGFGAVDIKTEGAAAISSRNDNALLIGNGFLDSLNAPVADIEGSAINIALTSISADGGSLPGSVGMRFKDSSGRLIVFGDGKNVSSGGVIKNTEIGILMEDAGAVGLQTVDFTDNGKLAEVHNANSLIISGSTVTGTTNQFVDATNLIQMQILQSSFTNNTLTSSAGIRYVVDQLGSYTASVSGNLVTTTPGTFFSTQTLPGGEGASLAYAFQGNAVDLGAVANAAAADLNWTGPMQAFLTGNSIVGTGASQTGLRVLAGDTTSLSQFNLSQNGITLGGANSVGIDLDSQSMMNIVADANVIWMNGQNQTAFRALLGKSSGVAMAENSIVDNAGGGTGILFTSIEDGSQIALDKNSIDLSQFSTFVDQGIIVNAFTAAGGGTPVVTFFSSVSNTISGATTPYNFPASGGRGRLIINDSIIFP